MAFCENCGAEKADLNAQCSKCGGPDDGQYFQPVPYMPPPPRSPDEDVGKALGIIALIVVIIVIVVVIAAAFFYVMVIGMGSPNDFTSAPVGAWSSMEATSTTAELTFSTLSPSPSVMDIRIYVQEEGSNAGYLTFTGEPTSATTTLSWVGGPPGASAEYSDYNYAGGQINSGDSITIEGLSPDTTYSVEVFYVPTDSVVPMVGAGPTFTTEP